jgi:hypothetical protein
MTELTVEQRVDAAVDVVRPEAKEYVDSLDAIKISTTKDNYGNVLGFLGKLLKASGEMAPLFLIAMVGEGYPAETAHQLVTLFQWPVSVTEAIERAATK